MFGIISGYCYANKRFNFSRVLNIWLTVLFYSIVSFVIKTVIWPDSFSVKEMIRCVLPVLEKKYWYVTAYFMTMMLQPVYSIVTHNISKKQYFYGLVGIGFCFTILSMVFEPWSVQFGYSWIWLTYLYFVGAYIRQYNIFLRKRTSLTVYCISVLCVIIMKMFGEFYGLESALTARFFSTAYNYNNVFVLTAAVSLFLLFNCIQTNRSNILLPLLSKTTFGIYLIHSILISVFINFVPRYIGILPIYIMVMIVSVFVFSIIIDLIRMVFFHVTKIDFLSEKIIEMLKQKISVKIEGGS